MSLIRIEYDKKKCVGAKKCVEHCNTHFRMVGDTAHLIDSSEEGSLLCKEVECNIPQIQKITSAARTCPTNAIRVADMDSNLELVGVHIHADEAQEHIADYDDIRDFVLDTAGYLLIRINETTKELEVGFCGKRNTVEVIVRGSKPVDVYHTMAKLHLITRMEHASYLGRELQKAYLCLKAGKKYIQDDELEF
jgi:ferredoxin